MVINQVPCCYVLAKCVQWQMKLPLSTPYLNCIFSLFISHIASNNVRFHMNSHVHSACVSDQHESANASNESEMGTLFCTCAFARTAMKLSMERFHQ